MAKIISNWSRCFHDHHSGPWLARPPIGDFDSQGCEYRPAVAGRNRCPAVTSRSVSQRNLQLEISTHSDWLRTGGTATDSRQTVELGGQFAAPEVECIVYQRGKSCISLAAEECPTAVGKEHGRWQKVRKSSVFLDPQTI